MEKAKSEGIKLASERVDDVLTYALFPQVGLKQRNIQGVKGSHWNCLKVVIIKAVDYG